MPRVRIALGEEESASVEAMTEAIYGRVLPFLETRGVYLTWCGNHAKHRASGSDKYVTITTERKAFDVERIMQVYPALDRTLFETDGSSYRLKRIMVEEPMDKYITNGDFIMAMLVAGYTAVMTDDSVNCTFLPPK